MVDVEKLEKEALDILEKNDDIYFFSDLCIELGYNRQYLYSIGFSPDKNDNLKQAIEKNKKLVKRHLRNKWLKSENATVQVALYKLLADEEELSRLNNNIDVSMNGKQFNITVADEKAKDALENL